jgi:hypothetical protein
MTYVVRLKLDCIQLICSIQQPCIVRTTVKTLLQARGPYNGLMDLIDTRTKANDADPIRTLSLGQTAFPRRILFAAYSRRVLRAIQTVAWRLNVCYR